MKKLIISLGSVLVLTFVLVFFVNSPVTGQDQNKKAKTEVTKTCTHAATCDKNAKCDKCTNCDPAKCKEAGCDHKAGTCDPATCKSHVEKGKKEGKACDPAKCTGTCKGKK